MWEAEYSKYTAKTRRDASTPLKTLLGKSLIPRGAKILDFGCGKGSDVHTLQELGYDVTGYDPYQPPYDDDSVLTKNTYDVVLNFYVLNVLPPTERVGILKTIWRVLKPDGTLFVAVRSVKEGTKPKNARPYLDGYLIKRAGGIEVFQKWYTEIELKEEIMGIPPGFEAIQGFFWPPETLRYDWSLLVRTTKHYP